MVNGLKLCVWLINDHRVAITHDDRYKASLLEKKICFARHAVGANTWLLTAVADCHRGWTLNCGSVGDLGTKMKLRSVCFWIHHDP